MEVLASFVDRNERHTIPDRVWRYMAGDQPFVDDMKKPVMTYNFSRTEPSKPAHPKQKLIGCRYHKVDDGEIKDIKKSLTELEKKIGDMAQGMVGMLNQLDK